MFGILISVLQVVFTTTQKDNLSLMFNEHINSLLELPQSIDNLLLEIDKKCLVIKDFRANKRTFLVRN